VPTRPGTLVVPGPRVDWWDSRAGEARSATLPPITLQVAPGAMPTAEPEPSAPSADAIPGEPTRRPWALGALAVLAVAMVVAGLAWRSRMQRSSRTAGTPTNSGTAPAPTTATPPPLPRVDVPMGSHASAGVLAEVLGLPTVPVDAVPSASLPRLARALELGDLSDVEAALRGLAGDGADLDTVIERLDDPAQRDAVAQLRLARWADGDAALARSQLRRAFAGGPRWRVVAAPERDALPPLYPEH
jgi:hypothetical protein